MRLTCPSCGNVRDAVESFICDCGWKRTLATPSATPSKPLSHEERGRRAWKLLHEYRPEVWSATEAEVWFRKTWMRQIPRYGCNCQSEFKKILERIPPDFSSQEAFFVWAVAVHNAVNEKLGRKTWTVEEALDVWG